MSNDEGSAGRYSPQWGARIGRAARAPAGCGVGAPRRQLSRVFGGAEVDEAFDAIDFTDGDLEGTAELEAALVAPADEGGVVIGGVIEITGQRSRGHEAEGERFRELDEEAVGADFSDDGREDGFVGLGHFALEELEGLDLHALALGLGGVDLGEAEVLAHGIDLGLRVGQGAHEFVAFGFSGFGFGAGNGGFGTGVDGGIAVGAGEVLVAAALAGEVGVEHAVDDEIGVAADGRREVGVVFFSEAVVAVGRGAIGGFFEAPQKVDA